MLLFLIALIMFLTDNMMFLCVCFTRCGILSAITCLWAFLITVSLSADAVLPDIAMKKNKINKK